MRMVNGNAKNSVFIKKRHVPHQNNLKKKNTKHNKATAAADDHVMIKCHAQHDRLCWIVVPLHVALSLLMC